VKRFVLIAALLLVSLDVDAANVTVVVSGHGVHLDVRRPLRTIGGPAIVFESGLGTVGTTDWTSVVPRLCGVERCVRYDRPGYGASDDDGEAPTLRHVATVLHGALMAAGVAPPYVLVGHSLGGARIRMFAGLYPNEAVGLVFVDPTPDFTRTPDDLQEIFLPLGLGRKEQEEMESLQQPPAASLPKSIVAEANMSRAMVDSQFADIRAVPPLPDIPVVVLVGGSDAEWPASLPVSFDMHRWVRQWLDVRNASLRRFAFSVRRGTFLETMRSSHNIQRSEPELVVWAVQRALQQHKER
jgi:pimeloyl-ACP methyl ester carboxylesterase